MIAVSILSALLGIFAGIGIWIIHNNRHPRKVPSLTKYVAFSIGLLIVYTVAEMVISTKTGIQHDNLSTCVFACFGGEILSCALIKVFKLKEENNDADG